MIIGLTNIYDVNIGPAQIIFGNKIIPITLLQTENINNGLNKAEIDEKLTGDIPDIVNVKFKHTIYNNVKVEFYGQNRSTHSMSSVEKIKESIEEISQQNFLPTIEEYNELVENIKELDNVIELEKIQDIIEDITISNNTELISALDIIVENEIIELTEHIDNNDQTVVEQAVEQAVVKPLVKKEKKIKKSVDTKIKVETVIEPIIDTIIENIIEVEPIVESVVEQVVESVVEQVVEQVIESVIVEDKPKVSKKVKVKKEDVEIIEKLKSDDIFTDRHNDDLYNEKI